MASYIYIAGSFETVNRSKCGRGKGWIDNDPHFWTNPPTWGICRNDLRRKVSPGDFIIFVLPKKGKHPQMIFGYLKIREIISHIEAIKKKDLRTKKMGNKNPNGNIIVDENGNYNRFDKDFHRRMFGRIKEHYAVGCRHNSKFLNAEKINQLAPLFLDKLQTITGKKGKRPIDIISRYGSELSNNQVSQLIEWVNA